jgi:FtsP/CotA-like multicopper oxidase with cupredoxin domain
MDKLTRREFVKRTAIAAAGLSVPWKLSVARAQVGTPQIPLPGSAIPQFVDPLPELAEMGAIVADANEIKLTMSEFQAETLPTGTFAPGVKPLTWVWGYLPVGQASRTTHIGPIVIATRGQPTQFRFINNLGNAEATQVLAYKNSTDQTLAWADPTGGESNICATSAAGTPGMPPSVTCAENYTGPIPACVHIHGGEVPAWLDGGPDAWYTSDGNYKGHAFYTHPGVSAAGNEAVYRYPNSQEAAPVWFHDHTLGATRLNVYAGLAGAQPIIDPANDPANLPDLVPLVIQDRMFDTNGQLYFPAGVPFIPNPDHPYWVPEFLGDVICVNGKVWPFKTVEPKRYRFLFINGSNARTYEMFIAASTGGNLPMYQIGTDGGYLDQPALINRLVMMPGERATVIVDFGGLPVGATAIIRNVAKSPYPQGAAVNGRTTGRILQFRVAALTAPDMSYDPATMAPLRAPGKKVVRLADPATGKPAPGVVIHKKRQLTLNEVMGMPTNVGGIAYPGGPLEVLVNNTKYMGIDKGIARPDFTPITIGGITTFYSELPVEGETEVWEIINLTADAHPMHTHLTQVQILNRQAFDVGKYLAAYALAYGGVVKDGSGPPLDYNALNGDAALGGNPAVTPFLKGKAAPPPPNEAGWKDTVRSMPGEVTRILVRFAPTDLPASTPKEEAYYPFDPNHGHGYVWHCHIVDHEDNEMMRPISVQSNPNVNPLDRLYKGGGVDY